MNSVADLYPSRKGDRWQAIGREEPVVYSADRRGSPVAYEFIESYREDGFVVLEDLFADEEIRCLQDEARSLVTDESIKRRPEVIREPDSGDVRSIFRIHALNPLIEKLSSDKRLVELAEYILNDRVYIHQSRLNYKPGFRGKEFYWHSDFETWHVEDGMPNMRALSMSISLTENFEINGPLMLIPGSQNEFVSCADETPVKHFEQSLKKQEYGVPSDEALHRLVSHNGIRSTSGKPGNIVVFDCNTMHGSNSNITPFPRTNIFLVYNAISNRIARPNCQHPPRPEYIATRKSVKPVTKTDTCLIKHAS